MCIKLSACVNFHIYLPLFQELRNDLHEAKVSRLDEEDVVSRVEAKLQATKEELKSTKERLTFREIEAEKAKADKTQLEEFKWWRGCTVRRGACREQERQADCTCSR